MNVKALIRYIPRPLLLTLLSSVLYLSAFYVPHAWFLVFFALIPISMVARSTTPVRAYGYGLLFSFIVIGGCLSWLLSAIPSNTFNFELTFLFSLGVFLSWILAVVSIAPVLALWVLMVRVIRIRSTILYIGILSLLYVVLEYARMISFNVLSFESEVANPPWFSFGFIGYPLADGGMWLGLASFGGVYALSFVVVLVNLGMLHLFENAKKKWNRLFAVLVLVIGVSFIPMQEPQKEYYMDEVGIMSIHGTIDERAQLVQRAVDSLLIEGADTIVLPEGGRASTTDAVSIVKSASVSIGTNPRSLIGVYVSEETETLIRTKEVLTPQGEYFPTIVKGVLNLLSLQKTTNRLNPDHAFRTALTEEVVEADINTTALLCSEIFSPGLGSVLVHQNESDALFVLLSHSRFTYPHTLETDTRRALQVLAAESGVPVFVSGFRTPAYAIDRHGQVIEEIGSEKISEAKVILSTQPK